MNLPTYITLLRILIVPFFYISIAYYNHQRDYLRLCSLFLFVFASFTDALDGFIARKWNLKTSLGTFLDPLADKLLLVSAFIAVFISSLNLKPPLWVVIIVIFRDIFIIGGLITIFISTQKVTVKPNYLGKTTTFFQMMTIIFILMQVPIAPIFWFMTAGLTVASGIVYSISGARQLNESNFLNNRH